MEPANDPRDGALSPFPRSPWSRPSPGARGADPRSGVLSPFPQRPPSEGGRPPPSGPPPRHPGPPSAADGAERIAEFVDSSQKALGAENTLSPFPLAPLLGLELPRVFDKWRREGYLTPPSDQARCGACYAFAATGQLADRISIATERRVRHALSTQFVVSCLQSRFEYGCGGTLDIPPIYEALLPGGLLGGTYRQYVFPYSGQQWDPKPDPDPKSPCYYTPGAPECQADDGAPGARRALTLPTHCYPPRSKTGMACTGTVPCDIAFISRWYPDEPKYSFARVFHLSENTNAQHLYPGLAAAEHYKLSIPVPMTPRQFANNVRRIKEAIFQYGPVTAVIPIYKDFNAKFKPAGPAWSDPAYVYEVDQAPGNTITGLHHVLLVGWGADPGGEHWIVKNSWGVWWNYDGYFNARVGDPLLLAESNCHSALPFNPETGEAVEPFDHGRRRAALPAAARAARRKPPLLALFAVLALVALLALGLVAGRAGAPALGAPASGGGGAAVLPATKISAPRLYRAR